MVTKRNSASNRLLKVRMFNEFIVSSKVNWVAVYGAIIASVGLGLSVFNYFRDNAKIKIQYKKGWQFINSVAPYKENTSYDEIKVINYGRRPVKIEKVAIRQRGEKQWAIVSDSFVVFKNKLLTEENPTVDFYYESNLLNLDDAYYISAFDVAGRSYKKWLDRYGYCKEIIINKFKRSSNEK